MKMQELNNPRTGFTTMSVDSESCNHKPVYFGVVNINLDERTIGSVDVWRCVRCKKRFCEEKQLGIEELADLVGMPKIDPDAKWAVTVCKLQQGKYKWKLVKLKENGEIKHECIDENLISLKVIDFKVQDNNHWSFLIDDHVNSAVEI
jgi:ubiquitin C-terminal hydrolase